MEGVGLYSENAKELADFYKNIVGLKTTDELIMGDNDNELYVFKMDGGSNFYIVDHSKVKGRNQTPERIIFNLQVDDIETETKRLENAGVKKITGPYHLQNYGYISTFQDSDGNYFQFVQPQSSYENGN